jgi:hypothetical protein
MTGLAGACRAKNARSYEGVNWVGEIVLDCGQTGNYPVVAEKSPLRSLTTGQFSKSEIVWLRQPWENDQRRERMSRSVVEPVAQLHIDFARKVPVVSAEGQAVVFLDAAVGYV